jgi:hypothetical protein
MVNSDKRLDIEREKTSKSTYYKQGDFGIHQDSGILTVGGRLPIIDFYSVLSKLREFDSEPVSLRDYAEAICNSDTQIIRIPTGLTREAMLAVPKKGVYLVRDSPLLQEEWAKKVGDYFFQCYTDIKAIESSYREKHGNTFSREQSERPDWEIDKVNARMFPFSEDLAYNLVSQAEEEKRLPLEERNVTDITPSLCDGYRFRYNYSDFRNSEIIRWAFGDMTENLEMRVRLNGRISEKKWEFSGSMFEPESLDKIKNPVLHQLWFSPAELGEFHPMYAFNSHIIKFMGKDPEKFKKN